MLPLHNSARCVEYVQDAAGTYLIELSNENEWLAHQSNKYKREKKERKREQIDTESHLKIQSTRNLKQQQQKFQTQNERKK